MKADELTNKLREAIKLAPDVNKYLTPQTRLFLSAPIAYKSQDYMVEQIERLVKSLYANNIGGDFIDVMANVISGQLHDAYSKAWFDYGEQGGLPAYLNNAYQDDVLKQYEFVDQFFRDIIDARIDGKPLEPLLARAAMWGNRWRESYNNAAFLIEQENGGNLIWQIGEAEHCATCLALDGKVASAKEWAISGWKPQSQDLECHGYNCKCSLTPTDKRRSPKVLDELLALRIG